MSDGIIRAGREDPLDMLAEAFFGKSDGQFIEDMEARGQKQLVASELLPVANQGGYGDPDDAPYLALGFEFGEVVADDPIFRKAVLPDGWQKVGSDHSMWSYIVDEHGEQRVGVFFKAAFYDRHAHMYLINQCQCRHSQNSHPYVADNKSQRCEKCACAGFAAMTKEQKK